LCKVQDLNLCSTFSILEANFVTIVTNRKVKITSDRTRTPQISHNLQRSAVQCLCKIIAKDIVNRGIPSHTGKAKWNCEAISMPLSNEKYVGSVLLQKTMSKDGYQIKNQGELDQVFIQNHHPAIVSTVLFEIVQHMKTERSPNNAEEPGMKMIF